MQVSAFSTTIAANTQVTRYEPYTASLYILTKSITLVPARIELYDILTDVLCRQAICHPKPMRTMSPRHLLRSTGSVQCRSEKILDPQEERSGNKTWFLSTWSWTWTFRVPDRHCYCGDRMKLHVEAHLMDEHWQCGFKLSQWWICPK